MKKLHMSPWNFVCWWLVYHPNRNPVRLWRESAALYREVHKLRAERGRRY